MLVNRTPCVTQFEPDAKPSSGHGDGDSGDECGMGAGWEAAELCRPAGGR